MYVKNEVATKQIFLLFTIKICEEFTAIKTTGTTEQQEMLKILQAVYYALEKTA